MRMSFILGSVVAALAALAGLRLDEDEAGGGSPGRRDDGHRSPTSPRHVGGPDVEVDAADPRRLQPTRLLAQREGPPGARGGRPGRRRRRRPGGWAFRSTRSTRRAGSWPTHVGELLPFEETGGSDPTCGWTRPGSPPRSPSLADALAEADPAHADDYRDRAEAYATRAAARSIASCARRWRPCPKPIASWSPPTTRSATSPTATASRSSRPPFRASGPEAEASAAALRRGRSTRSPSTGCPRSSPSEEDDPEALRLVADETGVTIEEELIIESLGSAPAPMRRCCATTPS